MMKQRILTFLLVCSVIWAGVSTALYVRLKNNPKVIAITTDLNKETAATIPSSDIERLTFLRQFLDRYFNYDSNSFWQSQTSLAYLMTPDLRQDRLKEVDRLKEKVQQKNLSQQAHLIRLTQMKDGSFESVMSLQITEDGVRRNLFVTLKMGLTQTERSIENPWALNISKLVFAKSSPEVPAFDLTLNVKPSGATIVAIPCAVESIENSDDTVLQTRTTTLNTSEIQIGALKAGNTAIPLRVLCKEADFVFNVEFSGNSKDLYKSYPLSSAKPRVKSTPQAAPRQKDSYDKAIDDAMNIKSNF